MAKSSLTTPLKFAKYSGAGNTFFIANQVGSHRKLKQLVRDICDPFQGVGADGLLILRRGQEKRTYHWDFYNSDGSPAEMCGNAARCVGWFLAKKKKQKLPYYLHTGAGVVEIHVHSGDSIDVQMPKVSLTNPSLCVNGVGNKKSVQGVFVNTGVPHFVVHLTKSDDFNLAALNQNEALKNLARAIQAHPTFQPAGTNVTFYVKASKNRILSASFERGVGAFTHACGTGAVAAAYAHLDGQPGKIKVQVPGGLLSVIFAKKERPHLLGPAKHVADVTYHRPTGTTKKASPRA